MDKQPAANPTPVAPSEEESFVQGEGEPAPSQDALVNPAVEDSPAELTEIVENLEEEPEVPEHMNETFVDEDQPSDDMEVAASPHADPTLEGPSLPAANSEPPRNDDPPPGAPDYTPPRVDEGQDATRDMKPPAPPAVEPQEVSNKEATDGADDMERGTAKKEEGGEAGEQKVKREGSKREINSKFKDVQETGSWGGISNAEKAIVGAIGVAILVGVIVVLVVVLGKKPEPTKQLVPAATMAPTPKATPMPAGEKFQQILQGIAGNPATATLAASFPDDTSLYVGLTDDPEACLKMPHDCAMSWALYSDDFPPQSDNVVARFALSAIYYSLGGPNWKNNTNWLTTASYCQWYGLNCNRLQTHVEELDLGDNNLKGEIPVELSLIDTIAVMSMKENEISGTLPGDALASMPQLFVLYIQYNRLTGPIPDNLRNDHESLALLFIHGNNFTGPFPDVYCNDDGAVFTQFSLDCSRNECSAECCFSENCF